MNFKSWPKTHSEKLPIASSNNSYLPRLQVDYITQVFEEVKGGLTKKLFQEYSRPHFRSAILFRGLSSEPTNSGPIRNRSGDVPEHTTYKPGNEWGDSQSDPHPKAGVSQSQTTNSGPDDTYDNT